MGGYLTFAGVVGITGTMTNMSDGSWEIVMVGFDLHDILFSNYISPPSLGHRWK